MTDITDPGTINNGDTPDWDVLQTYFDAIYAVINNPGQLDNNNIKAAAAIAYSKLNLTGGIVTADLANDAVTSAKLANPDRYSAVNAGLVQLALASTYYTVCTYTVPAGGAGVYDLESHTRVSQDGASSAMLQSITVIRVNGSAQGIGSVKQEYIGSSGAGVIVRTHYDKARSVSLSVGDVVTVAAQTSAGSVFGADAHVSANYGYLFLERRST